MKTLTVIFIVVVITPFVIVGILIFKSCHFEIPLQQVYLNTNKMAEADSAIINHPYSCAIIAAYTFNKKDIKDDALRPVDAFVCAFFKDSLMLNADTIVFLDTKLRGPLKVNALEGFGFEINKAEKLKGCTVSIPSYQIALFGHYKYKYGSMQFFMD